MTAPEYITIYFCPECGYYGLDDVVFSLDGIGARKHVRDCSTECKTITYVPEPAEEK